MSRKFFLFAALLSSLSVIVTSIFITMLSYNSFYDIIKREARAQLSYIQSGLEAAGPAYLAGLEYQAGHRLTLIASNGTVLYDSAHNPEQMDNHLDRPEVQSALSLGVGENTRYSDTISQQTFYYAVQLADGSVLRIASTTASVVSSYDQMFWAVSAIIVAVLIAVALIRSLMTRRIVHHISTINLEHPETSEVYDELVPLMTRIREQRDQIRQQMGELDRGRREFTAITENMREGLLVLDREERVISCNKSALRLLNAWGRNPVGLHVLALNRSEPFRVVMESALQGALEELVELDGRICQLYTSPVTTQGAMQGLILLLMDVTEKQERERLRREFTSNVSHELKTPLTAISGYAEIMANGVAQEEDVPEFSRRIYGEAQKLIALVQDLMFLSKLEESRQPQKEPADLYTIANTVLSRLEPKAETHRVTLSVSGDPAQISGIPSVLEEMLYNLLDNAIKYNRPGGNVQVSVKQGDDSAVLTVSDTGIGIPKAEQERIFERFYRVDKSHNESVEGTGLGLAIVKHGAKLHSAKLTLESSRDGSQFQLTFPLSQAGDFSSKK